MSVPDGRYFGSSGACRDDGCRSGIGRRHNPFFREGRVDGWGESEAKVSERATARVSFDGRRIQVEELVHGVDHGIRRFAVDW